MINTNTEQRPFFLDFQSTTPVDPRVLDSMIPFYTWKYGNPHSMSHEYGWETEEAVELARERVGRLIGADAKEIVFTSGATESNNLALKGAAHFYGQKKRHIITTQTEHKCVLDSCRQLQQEGFEVSYLPVQKNGIVDIGLLKDTIRPGETLLTSIMAVNNEIGVVQPIEEIGALCKENKVLFHSDIAQAAGKIPVSVQSAHIDMASISAHKMYGPKGVGALYVRRRPRVRLEAIISGGGQERGMRSGTLAAPLIVGFGTAAQICNDEMESDSHHVSRLAQKLMDGIFNNLSHTFLNGDHSKRYPGNVNISFGFVEGESLLMALKGLAVSSGSACTSASLEPSYVLRALNVDEDLAHSSIRFGIGRFTTDKEIEKAIDLCTTNVTELREMSPLWEMHQEGIDIKKIEWVAH